jgi:hypothetical protein
MVVPHDNPNSQKLKAAADRTTPVNVVPSEFDIAVMKERDQLRALVEEAAARFEQIRLILVNHLDEPERSAFWKAVEGRNLMRGQSHPSESKKWLSERGYSSMDDGELATTLPPHDRTPGGAA